MKTSNLLSLFLILPFFGCSEKQSNNEKSKTEIENAAIKHKTEQLDSIYHINSNSKLPDYIKVDVDSMKVVSIIPLYGKDFRKNLPESNLDLDVNNIESIHQLEKHIKENSDKSKPIIGYLTVLNY